MPVGRTAECARIELLLDAARSGQSGALVLRGEAGIGKSALLRHAADRAADMKVLEARGVESESELPFAGLSELLLRPDRDRPARERRGGCPAHLSKPTQPMTSAAASAGFYASPGWNTTHPRIQLLTVEELLSGKGIDYPHLTSITFKKAPKSQPAQPPAATLWQGADTD